MDWVGVFLVLARAIPPGPKIHVGLLALIMLVTGVYVAVLAPLFRRR